MSALGVRKGQLLVRVDHGFLAYAIRKAKGRLHRKDESTTEVRKGKRDHKERCKKMRP